MIQPRVCGDYALHLFRECVHSDTTPRVRGLLGERLRALVHRRYNPACAGTTCPTWSLSTPAPIQPRVCGDYFGSSLPKRIRIDTTPRVRGLLNDVLGATIVVRYNPACAGTTCRHISRDRSYPIQPRVCGDYTRETPSMTAPPDTTPRVRGLHFRVEHRHS